MSLAPFFRSCRQNHSPRAGNAPTWNGRSPELWKQGNDVSKLGANEQLKPGVNVRVFCETFQAQSLLHVPHSITKKFFWILPTKCIYVFLMTKYKQRCRPSNRDSCVLPLERKMNFISHVDKIQASQDYTDISSWKHKGCFSYFTIFSSHKSQLIPNTPVTKLD